jgi:hypothetical protein
VRRTNIALIIDVSGSMSHLQTKLTQVVNSMIKTMKDVGENTYVSVTRFGSNVNVGGMFPIESLGYQHFNCNESSTRLFDGIGEGSESIDCGSDVNHLVMAFTDGHENSSMNFNMKKIKALIASKEKKGNWTFTIQLPPGEKRSFAQTFGIDEGNLREWEATEAGLDQVEQTTSRSLANYYQASAAGQRSVKNFYLTTDMSKVKPSEIKKVLHDMKDEFTVLKVDKEDAIKSFVERKTKKLYKKGTGFYQLTKSETIQPQKEILIKEKLTNSIYGGMKARKLIGLPEDGITNAKVSPGNHSGYDIFAQSGSTNRKLVRGTVLLIKKS